MQTHPHARMHITIYGAESAQSVRRIPKWFWLDANPTQENAMKFDKSIRIQIRWFRVVSSWSLYSVHAFRMCYLYVVKTLKYAVSVV